MTALFGSVATQAELAVTMAALKPYNELLTSYEEGPSTWSGSASSDVLIALNSWAAGAPITNMWDLTQ
jgi:hypothetical protein